MKFDVVTIFPSMVRAFLSEGVVARAAANDVLDVAVHDLRSFATDRHRTVDDPTVWWWARYGDEARAVRARRHSHL